MNYTQLQDKVKRYLKRTELADQVPDFILMAEAQLQRVLRVQAMLAVEERVSSKRAESHA